METKDLNTIVLGGSIKQKKTKKSPLSKDYKYYLKEGKPPRKKNKQKNNHIVVVKKSNTNKPKKVVKKPEVKKPEVKKPEVKKPKRSKRMSKKRGTRRLHKKHLKNRRVSFRCYPNNKKNINNVIKDTKSMNQDTLKEKLKEKGIEIKSNKESLLRDIFIFSELGGIKIKKE